MRIPITVITGVHPDAMAAAAVPLQWDLPRAVAVRHHIDVESKVLHRTVSDAHGVVDRAEIALDHACVSCALREDVLPTLARIADSGRWSSVVALPPVGTPPELLGEAIATEPQLSRRLCEPAVLVAAAGETLTEDLLGDALLAERGLHAADDDRRGVGEVLARMIEYADATVLTSTPDATGRGLVRALARPGAVLLAEASSLEASSVAALPDAPARRRWVTVERSGPLPTIRAAGVWRLDLKADRPFHPERLLDGIGLLGTGRHRSRGCFWLASRPGRIGVWDGAGGQLSIGTGNAWRDRPHTRIVIVGADPRPPGLEAAFETLQVSDRELRFRGPVWETQDDGFEPWLGPIRRAA